MSNSSLLDSNGEPVMSKGEVLSIIQEQPQRVAYEDVRSASKMAGFYRKVLIGGQETGYVVCVAPPCDTEITIITGKIKCMGRHHQRCHRHGRSYTSTPGRKPRKFIARSRDEVEEMLRKAAENGPAVKKNTKYAELWNHFAPTGRVSTESSKPIYQCCYCTFEFSSHVVTTFKEHVIEQCPNVPSDFRQLVENRNLGLDISHMSREQFLRRRRERRKAREEEDTPDDSTEVSDGGDEPDTNRKAVKILSDLLQLKDDPDAEPMEVTSEPPLSSYSDTDLERKIKEFKLKKLMKQVEEANLAMKERETGIREKEMSIKEKEVSIKEKEERIGLYHYLQRKFNENLPGRRINSNGITGKSLLEDALDTVMNGDCN